ncbi:MAG: esterase-like activity of phytase family protein [Chitinophagaceae bacterium]|nr:esterase-like activity of phytase family protein [Chitinophagaceae bacterium]MBL0333986.1 esterase-like activity of phytase family protein [Chitinophagaceae bacterium]
MRSIYSLLILLLAATSIHAQPLPNTIEHYSVEDIMLSSDYHKQVCISGMKYHNNKLYFASERCPIIIEADPKTAKVNRIISLQVPQEFEMEGMTSYGNKLYLISENTPAIYEVNVETGALGQLTLNINLPAKSKDGDGMEGIAANETDQKFYLLRERNDDLTRSQIYTCSVVPAADGKSFSLKYESTVELVLESPQWRYSDICFDAKSRKLYCMKSFAKGNKRQQFLECMDVDDKGMPLPATLKNMPVDNFTEASIAFKTQGYSMNLEGLTIDPDGNFYIVSDNTSGKANCELPAKEKTILLYLEKQQ